MNEQNFVEDTQDSTEDIQYQAYVALVEDFKEFIDTTVKAGKDSYKHVDLFNGKSLDESVTHTVPLEDDKAQLLAAACMDLANSTLWLYYHQNKFKDTEFAEVVNNNYPKYQVRVQQEMNQEGGQFYLRSWYSRAQKISRECQLKEYEGYKPKEQMTYVNVYLLVYAAMKSLRNGSLSRIMANIEHDSDKIGNLAFYFFTYILKDYKAGVKVENIAVRYNVTPRFIAGLIQKYRTHHPLYRKNLRGNAKMKKTLPEEVCEGIAGEYQNGKSVSDIAKDHKIAVGQTYKILHDYGKLSESLTEAETRKATQSRSPITDNVKARNREFAEFARMNTGKNLRDLADIYGISYSTAVNIAKSENIHKRAGVVVP